MAKIEIRRAIGTTVRTKRPCWLYAVMVNGHTVAYFPSSDEAEAYARDRYDRITKRHHV